MKKNNPRIKENITIVDRINVIESIVSSAFTYNEKDNTYEYTPYYMDMAEIIAIADNFLEGIKFEKDDQVYDLIINDAEISSLVLKFYPDDASSANKNYIILMNEINKYAVDRIEFKKQYLIHNNEGLTKIGEFCESLTKAMSNFTKLNLQGISDNDISDVIATIKRIGESDITEDNIINALKEAGHFNIDDKTKEIIDAKNEEIRELMKYKLLWDSRNIENDKK